MEFRVISMKKRRISAYEILAECKPLLNCFDLVINVLIIPVVLTIMITVGGTTQAMLNK